MKEILTTWGEAKKIAELLNLNPRTVRNALKGRSTSDLAKRIRVLAVKRGGMERT